MVSGYVSCVMMLFHRLLLALLLLAFVARTAPHAMADGMAATSAAMSDTAMSDTHSMSHGDMMTMADMGEPMSDGCDACRGEDMAMTGACVASACAPLFVAVPSPMLGRLPLAAHLSPASDTRGKGISGAPDPFPPKPVHL